MPSGIGECTSPSACPLESKLGGGKRQVGRVGRAREEVNTSTSPYNPHPPKKTPSPSTLLSERKGIHQWRKDLHDLARMKSLLAGGPRMESRGVKVGRRKRPSGHSRVALCICASDTRQARVCQGRANGQPAVGQKAGGGRQRNCVGGGSSRRGGRVGGIGWAWHARGGELVSGRTGSGRTAGREHRGVRARVDQKGCPTGAPAP